ncbi:glycosyltransferase family 4 protein [Rhizobium leguminosarum]|uniref:glycosyltransferase family 4 protein n=1 Tax=Rhizobium leguminosarum TaxID=384 RepID=UPI003F9DC7B1
MKLGVITRATEDAGGTYQYTQSTLKALQRVRGWDITLYGNPDDKILSAFGFPIQPQEATRWQLLRDLVTHVAGIRLADSFKGEDAVFAPTFLPALLHTRKPFIFSLHDLQERYYPENFSFMQRNWRHWIYRHLLKKADAVLCESDYVKSDIVKFYNIEADRIFVVPAPPINLERPVETADQLAKVREHYRLPDRFAFYPAQFWPHKNHLRLVEAFGRAVVAVPDLKLVLTGKKRDDYELVMASIKTAGLENKVIHVGYVETDDLFAIYRLATMLVMPSLFESVSIPVYEAFLAETPVAASGILALPEQIGEAGLLFDPMSSESIAKAMISLAENPALSRELAARGRQRMALMTANAYASQLEAAFESLKINRKRV